VYVAPREHVTDVWVDGRQLLDARRLTTLDEHAIQKKAAAFSRTGLDFKAQAAAAAEKKA
jgi:5-methylthioadenosine/S-adenosylhomocysteine deaminase